MSDAMLFAELLDGLKQIELSDDPRTPNLTVHIVTHQPGSIGGTPTATVQSVSAGFDWNQGKLLIFPSTPLTRLSEEDVAAIRVRAREGQSYRAYIDHQTIVALNKEVAALKSQIGKDTS